MVDLKTDIKFKAVLTVQCGSQKQKHCTQQLGQLIISKLSVIHIKLPINSISKLNLDRKPQEKKALSEYSYTKSHSFHSPKSLKHSFTLIQNFYEH